MFMTENHRVLLSLIGSALVNTNVDFNCFRPHWKELYTLALKQGVHGIIYDYVERLRPDLLPPTDLLLRWAGTITVMERIYAVYVNTIQKIAEIVNAENLAMMVLKGYGCSLNYPKPYRRPCGDIDIFIMARDGSHSVDMVMRVNNAIILNSKGKFIHDNDHHSVIQYGKFVIENHEHILDVNTHKSSKELDKLLEALASDCMWTSSEINGVILPSTKFNSIHLLRHMANDFATVKTTLRNVLDWGTFVAKNNIDWNYTYRIMHQANMHKFLNSINSICVDYLGYDSNLFYIEERDDILRDKVLEDILNLDFHKNIPCKSNKLNYCWTKTCRMWNNRWKYSIVYDESLLSSFMYSAINRINRF